MMRRADLWGALAIAAGAGLSGCSAITAAEISRDAMRLCPATHELQFDGGLFMSRARVVCAVPRVEVGRDPVR